MNELKQKSKELLKNYNEPTPPFWHKVGDVVVIVGSAAASILALTENPKSTVVSIGITAIIKIITNFRK